jgi:hypothetical protein
VNFQLVTGSAITVECSACHRHAVAGDQPYQSASQGDQRQPETVYADLDGEAYHAYYCAECAAKLSETDPTRAVNQFYTDTTGKEIDHDHLQNETGS